MWDDIQILTAQLHKLPLLDDDPVATQVVIGPNAKKPLKLDVPLFVSDMSYGALSEEANTALARGAELAGTGICSGEGGMRACHTNNCPVGIATQKPHLCQRLVIDQAAQRLKNLFRVATELMQVMARGCGHDHLNQFCIDDLTTLRREIAT